MCVTQQEQQQQDGKTIIIVQAELRGEGKGGEGGKRRALDTERQNLGGKGRARA